FLLLLPLQQLVFVVDIHGKRASLVSASLDNLSTSCHRRESTLVQIRRHCLALHDLLYVCSGKEPFEVTSFRRGNECLRAAFKILQQAFYPFFVQLRIDIVDEKNWIIIMTGII